VPPNGRKMNKSSLPFLQTPLRRAARRRSRPRDWGTADPRPHRGSGIRARAERWKRAAVEHPDGGPWRPRAGPAARRPSDRRDHRPSGRQASTTSSRRRAETPACAEASASPAVGRPASASGGGTRLGRRAPGTGRRRRSAAGRRRPGERTGRPERPPRDRAARAVRFPGRPASSGNHVHMCWEHLGRRLKRRGAGVRARRRAVRRSRPASRAPAPGAPGRPPRRSPLPFPHGARRVR
jgi:hypothetical protein